MARWQHEWNCVEKERWTHRLIPKLSTWMNRINRRHGVANFYLTQFLLGNGCFRKYLDRFGQAESPQCPNRRHRNM